jgi:putative tryptophan/tyrosine transport system substrate-binding protein
MKMKRILAIAVGPASDKSYPVMRGLIKADRVKEVRPYVAGLIAGLERLGHKRGDDFDIDYTTCEPAQLKKMVKAAIDEDKPDAIFAMSTSALKAAMAVTKDIPIVFPSISDPTEDGVVRSSAVPGKNATGIRAMRRQTAHECLELFKATVPSLRKIHALHKPNYGPAIRATTELKRAAKRARVAFSPMLVKSPKEIANKLSALKQTGAAGKPEVGVLVLPDDLVLSAWRGISELCQEKRLPTFFPVTDWVRSGSPSALAGYGVPQAACGEQAALHMHKILQGVPAKDLPVKRAGGFEWAVNKAVAQSIGLTIPDSVLKAADRVVG